MPNISKIQLPNDIVYDIADKVSGYVTASGAASAAPVQSVNSQTGVVTLSASDVGALPSNTVIPTKTSDLTNDSGFITGMTILSYGSSTWQDFLSAYNSNQVIYCRASSNSNPASGSQTRLAFMAYVSNATSPTNVEFQYYRSMSSHSATAQGDEVYVYKLTSAGTWTVTVRKASPNIVAGTGLSRSYSNDTVTLSLGEKIPTKTSDLTNDSGFITGVSSSDITTALGYTPYNSTNPNGYVNTAGASAAAPVQSVNGQTGTVVLDAEDVGALPDDTSIPTKISDLTNDQVYDLGTKTLATGGRIFLTSEEQSDILAMWNRGACAIRVTIYDRTCMLLKEQDITYDEFPLHVFSGPWGGLDVNGKPISKKIVLAVSTLTSYPIAMYVEINDVLSVNGQTGSVSLTASDIGALPNSTDYTIGFKLRTDRTSLKTATRTRYYRLLFTSADGTEWVPANTQYDNSSTSVKTVNTTPINPFGRIVYMSGTINVPADSTVVSDVVWDQYSVPLGYSFNTTGSAETLTYPKPVYVKCSPQSNGSAIIDSTTPYVQDLPNTEDGKIYIYLGVAYSTSDVELVINHPVYYYSAGAVRQWTNLPVWDGSVT